MQFNEVVKEIVLIIRFIGVGVCFVGRVIGGGLEAVKPQKTVTITTKTPSDFTNGPIWIMVLEEEREGCGSLS